MNQSAQQLIKGSERLKAEVEDYCIENDLNTGSAI